MRSHDCFLGGDLILPCAFVLPKHCLQFDRKVFFSTKDLFVFFISVTKSTDEIKPVFSSVDLGLPNSETSGRRNLRHSLLTRGNPHE